MDSRVVVPLVLCACLTSAHMMINANSERFGDLQGDLYLRLYKTLDNKTNLLFSPNSISASVGILYEASSGKTKEDIERVLFNYPILQPLTDRHKYATSSLRSSGGLTKFQQLTNLYSSKDYVLNGTFINKISSKYGTGINEKTDFTKAAQTATQINDWIAHTTEHSFKSLVKAEDLDANTEMVLVSVSDFYWQYYKLFNPSATVEEKFYINDKDTIMAPMMHMDNETLNMRIDSELDALVLLFRFFNKNYDLAILLPNKRGGIEEMKKRLLAPGATPIPEILKKTEPHVVNVALPKFFMISTIDIKDCLTKMGLEEIFTSNASFPGLAEYGKNLPDVFVSHAQHEAFINITEFQTVTTSASVQKVSKKTSTKGSTVNDPQTHFVPLEDTNRLWRTERSINDEPSMKQKPQPQPTAYEFNANHPFVYFISWTQVPAGTIHTLVGQVYDPSKYE